MFEQSLLVDHSGGRKTAAFAASLTAQIVTGGVLLITPLFYHDVLPSFRLPESIGVLARPHLPEAPAAETHPRSARSRGLAWRGVFHPPIVLRSDYPPAGPIISDDAPVLPSAGVSLPVGSSAGLPRFEAASPMEEAVKPHEIPVFAGGDVQAAKLIKRVVPAYPQAARQLHVSGTVRLLGIIGKDGTIQRLQILNGHPLLRQAAIDAVGQWVYRPTFLNGQPVEVEAPIDVIFTLR